MKLSLNSGGIKQFFLRHGEKLMLGVFVVVFGLMCWSFIKVEKYDKQPQDLLSKVTQVEQKIESSEPKPAMQEAGAVLPEPAFTQQIQELGRDKIDAANYRLIAWNYPLFDRKTRRGQPELLPVSDLQVAANHGALKIGKDKKAGHNWVVVTGLVPVAQQTAIYEAMFRDALMKRGDTDRPQYMTLEVERAIIDPSNPDSEPQWQPLDLGAIGQLYSQFEKVAEDIVPEELRLTAVCMPLPPLLGASHGPEVSHPGLATAAAGAAPAAPAAEQPPVVAAAEQPAGFGGFGAFGAAQEAAPPPQTQPAEEEQVASGAEQLYRIFDFSVQPLQSYRYRTRLALANPNKGMAPQFLQDPSLAQGDRVWTEWSEPSAIVTVPGIFRLWLETVDGARGNNEAEAALVVQKWDSGHAAEVVHRFSDLLRGKLLDETTQANVPDPLKGGAPAPANVVFDTGLALLDMTGGEMLPNTGRPVRAPGEALVLAADGSLTIRSQLSDASQISAAMAAAKPLEPQRRAPKEPAEETSPAPAGALDIFNLQNTDE